MLSAAILTWYKIKFQSRIATITAPTAANVVTGEKGVVNGLLSQAQTPLIAPLILPPLPTRGVIPCCEVPVPEATPVVPAIGHADDGSTWLVVPDMTPKRDGSIFVSFSRGKCPG
jgi:hypothetical protein